MEVPLYIYTEPDIACIVLAGRNLVNTLCTSEEDIWMSG